MARDEKLDLLHRIPLFSGVGRHLERLGMLSDEIDVPAGKVLMRQGEIGSDMMVIVVARWPSIATASGEHARRGGLLR